MAKTGSKSTKREVYHVMPVKAGGWEVKREKSKTAERKFATKAPAVELGKKLSRKASLGQLIVHKADFSIQTEWTYGADPRSSPG